MTTLIVCETCGYDAEKDDDIRPGRQLYQELIQALEIRQQENSDQYQKVTIKPFSCLMACKRHCAVQVRDDNKMSYTLGDLVPQQDHIDGLLDYVALHQASERGVVAYKQWPEMIKGKFITRFPPLIDFIEDENA